MYKHLEGIIPPILTTFDEDGNVDQKRLENFARFLKPHVQGFYVCGTYGSGVLMNVDERKRVLEVLSQFVDDKFKVIAHVGTTNTRDTLSLAKHAEAHHALAVAAVPPFYFRHNEEAVFSFFQDLINAVSIPVYLYDNPGATGITVSPELIDRLAKVGLHGVKDSTFDIGKTFQVMRKVKVEDFDVVIGSESLMLPAFLMGSRACISGLANVMPELMQKLFKTAIVRDFEQASLLQSDVLKMWDILHYGPSTSTAYAMLKVRGVDAGIPRRPILPIDPDLYKKIEAAMLQAESTWRV